ncbi:MAG: ATP-binding protein, partial [Bacteroidales bacterium]|nr:ATP-binding protein [Bacteroidales bacterium]
MNNKPTVSIAIGTTMFARYADLPNTVSHAIAEFIDNALQSYRNNKDYFQSVNPDFRFKVTIEFDWNTDDNRARKITISDNAGGLNFASFQKAFMTAETPEDNKGLNEFGMGMKTAAGWLGNKWSVRTSAIEESVERFYEFDLPYVLENDVKELPYDEIPSSESSHYTIVTIEEPTKNSPSQKSVDKIKLELASIYRQSLRANEMDLFVDGKPLSFDEYPILEAPFAKTPNGERIHWKKEIDFKFGKYRAKGFIAILKDINNTQNGLVLLRRGRVIVGAETDGRYFPKSLFG